MDHSPARPRVRRRAVIAATAAVCAAASLYAIHPALGATPALSVQYKTSTPASAGEAEPWFKIVNTGSAPLALNRVTLRYYFTADTTSPYVFACAWAVVGCSSITGTVGTLATPTATADHYLQISFTGGSVAAGADSGDIQLRLYRQDWQNVNQANDYSFNGADTSYAVNTNVAAYVGGSLAFGSAPAGGGPTTTTTTTTSPGGPPPSGPALFDDFHYSSSSDPALSAHGWSVRTGSGGPGVQNTWSAGAITFPSDSNAVGGKVMQLEATTDGTAGNTTQAEIDTTQRKFLEGTYAARVYFTDAPVSGQNGDHVNETFYTITPDESLYSELDNEYLPNGGWGAPGPTLYTTTWYSADAMDRVTHNVISSLAGWHTLVMTVAGGVVTYYVDGQVYFSSNGKYYPRDKMTIDFNEWFIDLPFAGQRTWDEKVNWVYFNGGGAMSPSQVDSAVSAYESAGTHFTDNVPG
jgi:hypothetical protein